MKGRNLVLICISSDPMQSFHKQLIYVIRSVDEKILVLESEGGDVSYVYSRQ